MCLNILSFGTNISGFCPKIFQFLSQHFQKYVQTFDILSEDFQNVCQYFQFLRQNSRFLSRDFQVSASKCFTTIVKKTGPSHIIFQKIREKNKKMRRKSHSDHLQGWSLGAARWNFRLFLGRGVSKDHPWERGLVFHAFFSGVFQSGNLQGSSLRAWSGYFS